jgi:hypothetical protein
MPSIDNQHLLPPRSLVNLDAARQRFGEQKVDLLIEMMHRGDEKADAVIAELVEGGPEARRKLNVGIRQGLAAVDEAGPALRALLEEVERQPDWVEEERLKRGSEAYLSIGQLWTILSLGPGSLTHTYSSPAIARVLVQTGNLTRMAKRRLFETGAWNIESVLPGGLEPGANGYAINLQVRLLHARVRTTLRARNWDESESGTPINQLDMVRTWLDFTYVPFSALLKFGISFTSAELDDIYHYWQYIAFLLGIDERLYRDVSNQKLGGELLALIDSTEEEANEDSRALTQAMLVAVSELLYEALGMQSGLGFDLASAITRRLHGNELADQLGVKRTWVSSVLPLLVLVTKVQRAWNRRSAAARKRAVAKTVQMFRQNLALNSGSTTYERNADDPGREQLPETVEPQVTAS